MAIMSTPSSNFTVDGVIFTDVGDDNDTGSAGVSGGTSGALNVGMENHDHSLGRGNPVPGNAIDMTNSPGLNGRQDGKGDDTGTARPIREVAEYGFTPVQAASVAIRGLFVDIVDERLKFKDATGTVRTINTTPPQP